MEMLDIPNEIRRMMMGLWGTQTTGRLCRLSRTFREVFSPLLYYDDAKSRCPLAVYRTIEHCEDTGIALVTLRRAKKAGANLEELRLTSLPTIFYRQNGRFIHAGKPPLSLPMTPLHLAAAKGLHEIVSFLLDTGIHVDTDLGSWTPLFVALYCGRDTMALELMKYGASPISNTSDMTALHFAAAGGCQESITHLVQRGFDVNSEDGHGNSPLHYSISSSTTRKKTTIPHLISLGADVNKAMVHGSVPITPLSLTCEIGRLDLAMDLLDGGADTKEPDNSNTPTAFELAFMVESRRTGPTPATKKALLTRLLAAGADPNQRVAMEPGEQRDITLLMKLISFRREWETRFLLEGKHILELEVRNSSGETALTLALSTRGGDPRIVTLLLRNGAKLEARAVRCILSQASRLSQATNFSAMAYTLARVPTLLEYIQILYDYSQLHSANNEEAVKTFLDELPKRLINSIQDMMEQQVPLKKGPFLRWCQDNVKQISKLEWTRRDNRSYYYSNQP